MWALHVSNKPLAPSPARTMKQNDGGDLLSFLPPEASSQGSVSLVPIGATMG
jgi:hypothetical protein